MKTVFNKTDYDFHVLSSYILVTGEETTYSYMVSQYGEAENIIYIRNEENVGQSAARNIGVRYARGKYVAF